MSKNRNELLVVLGFMKGSYTLIILSSWRILKDACFLGECRTCTSLSVENRDTNYVASSFMESELELILRLCPWSFKKRSKARWLFTSLNSTYGKVLFTHSLLHRKGSIVEKVERLEDFSYIPHPSVYCFFR